MFEFEFRERESHPLTLLASSGMRSSVEKNSDPKSVAGRCIDLSGSAVVLMISEKSHSVRQTHKIYSLNTSLYFLRISPKLYEASKLFSPSS